MGKEDDMLGMSIMDIRRANALKQKDKKPEEREEHQKPEKGKYLDRESRVSEER